MRRLLAFTARRYPRRWRQRYGAEFDALLDDLRPSVRTLLDVLRGAVRAHLEDEGDSVTATLPARHATRFGVAALLLVLPTAILLGLSMLKYVLGVAGPFDAVEPVLTPIVTHPLGETALIVAPCLSLLLATLPVTRVRVGRDAGRLTASVELAAPALNVVVALLSGAVGALLVVYYLIENF